MNIYALVNEGVVVNTVKADINFASSISEDYEAVVDVTNFKLVPSIGWKTFDNETFHPPVPGPGVWEFDEKYMEWVLLSLEPYPSWVWDDDRWVAPIPKPTDPGAWSWDEETRDWIPVPAPAE